MIESNAYGLLYIAIPVFAFAFVAVIQATLVFLVLHEILGMVERMITSNKEQKENRDGRRT